MTEEQRRQLSMLFSMQADAVYERHRLRYVHEEDGEETFVCICDQGFSERRNWNMHIRDAFREVAPDG